MKGKRVESGWQDCGTTTQTSLTNLTPFNLCGWLVLPGLMWVWRLLRDRRRDHLRRRHQVVCGL